MPNRPKTYKPAHLAHRRPPVERRPTAAQRGYGGRWQRYTAVYLHDHPFCQCGPECCPSGCGRKATDVDHIQAVTGPDDPRFWDETNHQALAHACHSRKTAREDGGRPR